MQSSASQCSSMQQRTCQIAVILITTCFNCTCHCAAAAADGMCIDKASWQSATNSKVTAPSLTKLDKAFEAEGCQFVWGMSDLTVSDLNALFQKVIYNIPSLTAMHNSSWLCWNQSLIPQLHTCSVHLEAGTCPGRLAFPKETQIACSLRLTTVTQCSGSEA